MNTEQSGFQMEHPWGRVGRRRGNENLARIQAALAQKCGAETGAYVGDGTSSRAVSLGFRPKAVLLERADSRRPMEGGNHNITAGLALDGHPVGSLLRIAQEGFQVCAEGSGSVNESGVTYHYLAIQ